MVWYRYVDDIFCIINRRKLTDTLNFINSKHADIQFTYEEEINNELPFLELKIMKKEDYSLKFKIYRKPTSTTRYITSNSCHNIQHKKSAFNSMIHRLLNIKMDKEDFDEELNTIYSIAKINGYNQCWINRIFRKMKRKQEIKNSTTHSIDRKQFDRRVAITYTPKISEKISNILSKQKLQVIHKSSNKIKKLTSALKDKRTHTEKSGIYSISCQNCPKIYIGLTKRRIIDRFCEHKRATLNNDRNSSAVATHMQESQHTFNRDNLNLITECTDNRKLGILESIYIQKYSGELMNLDEGQFSSFLFDNISTINQI